MEKPKRKTIQLDADTHYELKKAALDQKIELKELVNTILKSYIAKLSD